MKKIITTTQTTFRVMDSTRNEAGEKIPLVYGPLSFEENKSKKGYRYREGFWERVLSNDKVQEDIQNHVMLGMIEHPQDDNDYLKTPYDKASHVVWNVDLKKGIPYGTFALVNNQYGNAIKALVDLKVPVGVSTRGLGEYCTDSVSQYIDEDSYALITWDFTRSPNLEAASMSKINDSFMASPLFKEFIDAYKLRDSALECYSEAKLRNEMLQMKQVLQEQIAKLDLMLSNCN